MNYIFSHNYGKLYKNNPRETGVLTFEYINEETKLRRGVNLLYSGLKEIHAQDDCTLEFIYEGTDNEGNSMNHTDPVSIGAVAYLLNLVEFMRENEIEYSFVIDISEKLVEL